MFFIGEEEDNIPTYHNGNGFALCKYGGIFVGCNWCDHCDGFTGKLPSNTEHPLSVCHTTADCLRLKREGNLSKNRKSTCRELLQRVDALNEYLRREQSTMTSGNYSGRTKFSILDFNARNGVGEMRRRETGWMPNKHPPISIGEVEDIGE